ncbi:MAG: VCBS repeat-containing protein, partial [Phycisphaerae bacterium]|nr:VCBS repeat-containing protein [Phycisphaerae bacterium]
MTRRASGLLLATVAAVVLGIQASPAHGYIKRLYSLGAVLRESTHVAVGRLVKVDPRGKTAVMRLEKTLKGKLEYRQVNMNIGAGPSHHAAYLIARLRAGAPAILFYRRQGRSIASLVHSGDTWFQLFANDNPKARDKIWWRFTHVEAYMGRTYNGKTPQLIKLTTDVLAGRTKPPPPDPKVPMLDPRRARIVKAKPSPVKPGTGWFRKQKRFSCSKSSEVRGISFADVNGDELLDVYLCRDKGNTLLVNQGGDFKDAGKALGLSGGSRAGAWADYNGDDHPDLLTNDFKLFTSDGGRFRDDSRLLPAPRSRNSEGAGWIDYNGDGRPDILITNGEHGICLYENTGKGPGWFRDVSAAAGLGRRGLGAGNGDFITFWDYDSDGYADFIYNYGGGVLGRNRGSSGFQADKSSGISLGSGPKRGLVASDYDNDGDLDVFAPGGGGGRLYRNNNDGTFTDILNAGGDIALVRHESCSAAWGDVNGDGALDLMVCYGSKGARMYLGDGKGKFRDVSTQAGVTALRDVQAASLADLDNDGDLDIAANLSDSIVVAFNQVPRHKTNRPLSVR